MGCIIGITENSPGGQALRQQVPVGVELIATSRSGDPATGLLPLDLACCSRR